MSLGPENARSCVRAASVYAYERGFASIGAWLHDDREGSWELAARDLLAKAEAHPGRACLTDGEVLGQVRDALYYTAVQATLNDERRRAAEEKTKG